MLADITLTVDADPVTVEAITTEVLGWHPGDAHLTGYFTETALPAADAKRVAYQLRLRGIGVTYIGDAT